MEIYKYKTNLNNLRITQQTVFVTPWQRQNYVIFGA